MNGLAMTKAELQQLSADMAVKVMGWHEAHFAVSDDKVQHVWAQGYNPQAMRYNVRDWNPAESLDTCAIAEAKMAETGKHIPYAVLLGDITTDDIPDDIPLDKENFSREEFANLLYAYLCATAKPHIRCLAMVKVMERA